MIFKIIIGAKIEKIFKTKRFVVKFREKSLPTRFSFTFIAKNKKKTKTKIKNSIAKKQFYKECI